MFFFGMKLNKDLQFLGGSNKKSPSKEEINKVSAQNIKHPITPKVLYSSLAKTALTEWLEISFFMKEDISGYLCKVTSRHFKNTCSKLSTNDQIDLILLAYLNITFLSLKSM